MESYARELRASHLAWQELLSPLRPGRDQSQIASEALEMALKELEDRLPSEFGRTAARRFSSTQLCSSSAVTRRAGNTAQEPPTLPV